MQDLSRHLLRKSAPLTHPGLRQMTRFMAGLLAHGSLALFRLPAVLPLKEGKNNSGIMEPSLAAYSCGGSQGIGRAIRVEKPSFTLFPLASFGRDIGSCLRNHQAGRTIGMATCVSNGSSHEKAYRAPQGQCIA